MTLVAGITDGTDVWMAGDRSALSAEELTADSLHQRKVLRKGDFLIGGSESFRMIQLLEHAFEPPPGHDCGQLTRYMVTGFVPAVRELMTSSGFSETGEEAGPPGQLLVGVHGHLYVIQGDYAVMESLQPFDAIGCPVAFLGAIRALRAAAPDLHPASQLTAAVQATAAVTFAVQSPFDILSTRG